MLEILFCLLSVSANAETSAFDQAMSTDTAVETHESNAEFFNVKYRKIETKTAVFYVKAAPGPANAIEAYCGQPKFFSPEHLKEGNPIVFQRTREFLAALNESCNTGEKKKKMNLDLQPKDSAKK
jgi:hypothetical protein